MQKRLLTVSSMSVYNRKEMPVIRLQGRWLEKLGFEIGKRVTVEESPNRLVLEVAKDET